MTITRTPALGGEKVNIATGKFKKSTIFVKQYSFLFDKKPNVPITYI